MYGYIKYEKEVPSHGNHEKNSRVGVPFIL